MPHPKAKSLHGLFTAIHSTFTADGSLDLKQMPALIDFQRQNGADGLVVCGTNGEGTSLSVNEHKALLETVLANKGKMKVIAGTGSASTVDALELTRHAVEAGADGALILPPFYFKQPPTAGVAAYYRPIIEQCDIPIILYHIPQFSAVGISEELLSLLSDCPNLSGIKDSTSEWSSLQNHINRYPDYQIFIGSDLQCARGLSHGAAGGISGSANCFPDVIREVWKAHESGDNEGMFKAQERLDQFLDILHRYPAISVSKSILSHRGFPRMHVRAPLRNLSMEMEEKLVSELKELKLL